MDDVLLNSIERKLMGGGNAQLVISLPSYDSSGNLEYIGYAMQGTPTSSAGWKIKKLSYDSSGNWNGDTWSKVNQIFDNRALSSVTYS